MCLLHLLTLRRLLTLELMLLLQLLSLHFLLMLDSLLPHGGRHFQPMAERNAQVLKMLLGQMR